MSAATRPPAVPPMPPPMPPPRHVLLFTGHLVDAPDRPTARFPTGLVPFAAHRIEAALARLDAGPADLALTQGAAGGDLLFVEACQSREVPVRLLLPFGEDEFIERSVRPVAHGAQWEARYRAARARLGETPREAPHELGPLAEGADPFVRANLWLLESALAFGAERLRCICLWDGGGGDGPGGTRHLVEAVRDAGGIVVWIDTHTL